MNTSKPYNYRELEARFPEQPPQVVRKRIKRIRDKLKSYGYEEVTSWMDAGIVCRQK